MKLMEVGTISSPQPTLLTINVWDVSVVKDVEKAILESNIGLTPSVDGSTVRLAIPPLTEERRTEFVKLAHQKGEHTRVEIRQIRGDVRDDWKKEEDSGEIGEDELRRREKILQDLVDKSISTVDEYVKAKEDDLMQF
jgi:ribosome recycling factor